VKHSPGCSIWWDTKDVCDCQRKPDVYATIKAPLVETCSSCGATMRLMVPVRDAIAVTQRDIPLREVEGMTEEFFTLAFEGECPTCLNPVLPAWFDGVTVLVTVRCGAFGEAERLPYTYESTTVEGLLAIVEGTKENLHGTAYIEGITLTDSLRGKTYTYPRLVARRLIESLTRELTGMKAGTRKWRSL
jgi:hypothetical protein